MQIEKPIKYYINLENFEDDRKILRNYQKTRNILFTDYSNLLSLTLNVKDDQKAFNALYRACSRELFTLIEFDLFSLNQLDNYTDYSDKENFLLKFEKTFKQICLTWEKTDLLEDYFGEKTERLGYIKTERDKMTRPENPKAIKMNTVDDLRQLKLVFNEYKAFMNKILNGLFIGMKSYPVN